MDYEEFDQNDMAQDRAADEWYENQFGSFVTPKTEEDLWSTTDED